ncbi:MAG TPA: glycosyltransferase family 4 protein [Longimicrobium sp.]|nr:glycosyltransferase family 4 protein [Longimicrobium sp.]
MRVVQVSFFRDPARRSAAELVEAWPTLTAVAGAAADAGVEVAVVQAAWRDDVRQRAGVTLHFVAEPGARVLPRRLSSAFPARLLARVRSLRPDVVHVQGLGFPVSTRLASTLGAPVMVQDHSGRLPPPSRRALHRWGLARVAGAAFTDRAQAEPFFAAGLLRPGLPVFEVLESSSTFTPGDVAAARAAAGIHGDPCVLFVGRLNEGKDPLTVLDAFARAAPRLPDARLWMVYGDAPMLDAVQARIAGDEALRDRVRLLGRVPHARIETLARAADLFVSASRRESAGYAVLEAIACGAVPLLADIPAHRRITRGGAIGGLFPLGNADALAARLVEHADRDRAEARRRAREHFDRHLSFAALGRELRDAYEQTARGA